MTYLLGQPLPRPKGALFVLLHGSGQIKSSAASIDSGDQSHAGNTSLLTLTSTQSAISRLQRLPWPRPVLVFISDNKCQSAGN